MAAAVLLAGPPAAVWQEPTGLDVRRFGARADGRTVDSDAINAAIDAAAKAGGGIVDFPAGRYLSFSIRLKSHVTLRFSPGAVLVAGDPASGLGKYDPPEANPSDAYPDFGHSHWRNSLISGISIRRVLISHVVAYNAEPRFASIIAGIPGHPVEDVTLSDIRLVYRGGGSAEDARREPPEVENAYPDPSMFGTLPAFGFYVRHAAKISMRDVIVTTTGPDDRPPMVLHDVRGMMLDHVEATRPAATPFAILRDVNDLHVRNVDGVADGRHARVDAGVLPQK